MMKMMQSRVTRCRRKIEKSERGELGMDGRIMRRRESDIGALAIIEVGAERRIITYMEFL